MQDLEQTLADEATTQDQAALGIEDVGEVGRSQLRSRAHLLERPSEPGGHLDRAVAEQDFETLAAVEQHARVTGPPAQDAVVREVAHRDGVP
jgi:hypothetical protein